jgi:ABC-2 type transport system ATP-binding protein
VRAPASADLLHRIAALDGVEQVAPFGTALHVVGTDVKRLQASLAPLANEIGVRVEPGATSLEDVFIHFMAGAEAKPNSPSRAA